MNHIGVGNSGTWFKLGSGDKVGYVTRHLLGTLIAPTTVAREEIFMLGGRMNWDQMKGNWKQFKGKAKEQWGKLTDDELDQVEGKRDQLVGKIQKQYGISKEEAERQVGDWEGRL